MLITTTYCCWGGNGPSALTAGVGNHIHVVLLVGNRSSPPVEGLGGEEAGLFVPIHSSMVQSSYVFRAGVICLRSARFMYLQEKEGGSQLVAR